MFLQINVVRAAYMRYFHCHADELAKYFDTVFRLDARTSNGYRYDPGWGTRSGSPVTTDANTMINAYICYCALRSSGYDKAKAWESLGLYYGDDGVHRNIPGLKNSLVTVAKEIGLSIEIKSTEVCEPIPYLGRIFIDPLTTGDSFSDPHRFMPKLHLSSNKMVKIEQAAYNKAVGCYTTDHYTPILSDWCMKVFALSGIEQPKSMLSEELWKLGHPWPQRDKDLIHMSFCTHMGWTTEELEYNQNAIKNSPSLFQMPIIWDNERQVKTDTVFGGELLLVETRLRECNPPKLEKENEQPKCQISEVIKPTVTNCTKRMENGNSKPRNPSSSRYTTSKEKSNPIRGRASKPSTSRHKKR